MERRNPDDPYPTGRRRIPVRHRRRVRDPVSASRDPVTGRFTSAMHTASNLVAGIIGLWLVSRLVMPGRQTAAVIQAMGAGFDSMIKVATAERVIADRDIPRVESLLGEMTDDVMTTLFAGLNDTDLDWIESHLTIGME